MRGFFIPKIMIVEIIKEHVNGLSVGLVQDFTQNVAIKLIRDGYAVEATNEQLIEYRKAANEIISARSRMMKQRIEDNILEKEKEAAEKKNSDADVKLVVSDIEAIKAEYFDLGVQQGTEEGYNQGHAEGYKLGYDACLAEMANNIFPEPEPEECSHGITEPENTDHETYIEPVITLHSPQIAMNPEAEPEAEPDKPKRGRPATK